jgi:arylsulfatase A-like enzyme
MAAAGYETYLCGKWHLGSTPDHGPGHFGFEHSYGSLAGAVGMYDHRYREGAFGETWHRDHALIEGFENGEHATDLVTRDAVAFIERERERPFFLYLAYHAVHTPLDERGPFTDRPTQLDPADSTRWLDEDRIPWFHDPLGKIQAEPDPERRLFLAALHHLDHSLGELITALERSGQRERTLILFSSDNGPQGSWGGNAYPDDLKLTDFNQPSPWRGKKLDVYEGGIRVPGFVSWPGTLEPGVLEAPVHLVDWFPTLQSLIGTPASGDPALDGVDLLPALRSGAALPERSLYWTWNQRTNRWALLQGNWKLVRYGPEAPQHPEDWQLFDLANDPAERMDLSDALPERLTELHQVYLQQRVFDAPAP